MASVTWGSTGAVLNLLTGTQMNGLAAATLSALGPEINNTLGAQLGQLVLNLGSAAFTAGMNVGVYFLPSNDTAGTIYPTLGTFAQEALNNYLADYIYIKGTTAAQLEIKNNVQIPSGKFKTFIATSSGAATLAGSGNTLDLYPTPTLVV